MTLHFSSSRKQKPSIYALFWKCQETSIIQWKEIQEWYMHKTSPMWTRIYHLTLLKLLASLTNHQLFHHSLPSLPTKHPSTSTVPCLYIRILRTSINSYNWERNQSNLYFHSSLQNKNATNQFVDSPAEKVQKRE